MTDLVAPRYDIAFKLYPYEQHVDQQAAKPVRHKVIIVGGGAIGLATALDLGRKGVPVLVLDDHEGAGLGSKAICFAKPTLEICDRLGAADAMLAKGVLWNVGKVFHDDRLLYECNLQPEAGHAHPAYINLQQPYVEQFLHEAIVAARSEGALIEIRGRNRVDAVDVNDTGASLSVMTPDGAWNPPASGPAWMPCCGPM